MYRRRRRGRRPPEFRRGAQGSRGDAQGKAPGRLRVRPAGGVCRCRAMRPGRGPLRQSRAFAVRTAGGRRGGGSGTGRPAPLDPAAGPRGLSGGSTGRGLAWGTPGRTPGRLRRRPRSRRRRGPCEVRRRDGPPVSGSDPPRRGRTAGCIHRGGAPLTVPHAGARTGARCTGSHGPGLRGRLPGSGPVLPGAFPRRSVPGSPGLVSRTLTGSGHLHPAPPGLLLRRRRRDDGPLPRPGLEASPGTRAKPSLAPSRPGHRRVQVVAHRVAISR